jgi:hypothetical protein
MINIHEDLQDVLHIADLYVEEDSDADDAEVFVGSIITDEISNGDGLGSRSW